jgi:aminoglycoside 3-N-acetyltransferase
MRKTRDMKDLAELESERSVVGSEELSGGLTELGVEHGDTLIVHCSLAAFGFVAGGEQQVLQALRDAVGLLGTVAMPSQSWHLCDPDFLDDPAMDSDTRELVRRRLPAFDPVLTPTRTMGRTAELFRTLPGSVRSPHPHRSFTANGPAATHLMSEHPHDDPFGERSPLARLYEDRAKVLLLGVGYESCTALHLAETRAAGGGTRSLVHNGAPLWVDGRREWVSWQEPTVDDTDFARIGEQFDQTGEVRRATIGSAQCRSMEFVGLVDFAQRWLAACDCKELQT